MELEFTYFDLAYLELANRSEKIFLMLSPEDCEPFVDELNLQVKE